MEACSTGWQCRGLDLRPLPDPGRELLDLLVDAAIAIHARADLPVGMHHGRMVAAECLADLGQ